MLASLALRKMEIRVTKRDHFIHPGTANSEKINVGEGVVKYDPHIDSTNHLEGNLTICIKIIDTKC